jgi:hypothetical protein
VKEEKEKRRKRKRRKRKRRKRKKKERRKLHTSSALVENRYFAKRHGALAKF